MIDHERNQKHISVRKLQAILRDLRDESLHVRVSPVGDLAVISVDSRGKPKSHLAYIDLGREKLEWLA